MENFFFFSLLRKTIVQFLDVFNDIKVAKYNKDGSIAQQIVVPVKFAHKEKFYLWLNQKSNVIRLPMIGASITGYNFDQDRMGNKNHKYSFLTSPTTSAPTSGFLNQSNIYPWNISFSLQVATLYMVEMDQVLEQILPYFDPNIFVTIDIPEINNSFNAKVILNSVVPRWDVDLQESDYRTLITELNFTVQTYILRPVGNIGVIKEIDLNFFTGPQGTEDVEKLIVYEDLHVGAG